MTPKIEIVITVILMKQGLTSSGKKISCKEIFLFLILSNKKLAKFEK